MTKHLDIGYEGQLATSESRSTKSHDRNMDIREQEENMVAKSARDVQGRIQTIDAIKTPFNFFVLIVLIAEALFLAAAVSVSFEDQRQEIVLAMIALFFLSLVIVAGCAIWRPEALRGARAEDPELMRMRKNFKEVETLADMISGKWRISSTYIADENHAPVRAEATCQISRGTYGVSMHGNALNDDGSLGPPFVVKQAFLSEDGLTYIFQVPQDLSHTIFGVAQVRFVVPALDDGKKIDEMKGNWAVIGMQARGEAEFMRQE